MIPKKSQHLIAHKNPCHAPRPPRHQHGKVKPQIHHVRLLPGDLRVEPADAHVKKALPRCGVLCAVAGHPGGMAEIPVATRPGND